jgi:DNA-directed RNA polymerase specialized sigma24 family protein
LADEGLSAKQIAEQLRLPSGEVELALKLQRVAS